MRNLMNYPPLVIAILPILELVEWNVERFPALGSDA